MLEKKEDRLRIYVDKFRDYRDSQTIFTIATDYDRGRFYHRGKTMELYYDKTSNVRQEEKRERLGRAKRSKAQTI